MHGTQVLHSCHIIIPKSTFRADDCRIAIRPLGEVLLKSTSSDACAVKAVVKLAGGPGSIEEAENITLFVVN